MRVYGHAYQDTMNLPMRVFWQLSGSVPRLLAGESRDYLELMTTATHNPAGAAEKHRALSEYAPEPVKLSAQAMVAARSVRDEDGFNELRSMSGSLTR